MNYKEPLSNAPMTPVIYTPVILWLTELWANEPTVASYSLVSKNSCWNAAPYVFRATFEFLTYFTIFNFNKCYIYITQYTLNLSSLLTIWLHSITISCEFTYNYGVIGYQVTAAKAEAIITLDKF